jgi:hypothetical protein
MKKTLRERIAALAAMKWAALNPPNSPFSPLTGPRLLTGLMRSAPLCRVFELAVDRVLE